MNYLVVELTARKANMLQSLGILSAAPVLPAVLLAHALDKELQGDSPHPALGVRGVGLVHRNAQPWIERMENDKGYLEASIVQRRAGCMFDKDDIVKNGGPQANSMQPMALVDLEWTLLLRCTENASDMADKAKSMLSRMRLAGGVIHGVRDEWDKALAHALRTGHWIEDVTPELHAMTQEGDPMLAVLKAVESEDAGWVVPANLGYALLEVPKEERRGSRDGKPHAFAEHMIGAIRYVPTSTIERRTAAMPHDAESGVTIKRTLRPDDLWRHGWSDDQFLVTNHKAVSLSSFRSVPVASSL